LLPLIANVRAADTHMAIDDRDLAAWAARIRPHFSVAEQDTAEAAAYWFATSIGSKVKELRPDTSMGAVLSWLKAAPRGFSGLDWVELLMALEAEASSEVTDEFAEKIETRTFADYVSHLAARKRPNK
jgi:hypothetical protein